jgi:hypothetical protein
MFAKSIRFAILGLFVMTPRMAMAQLEGQPKVRVGPNAHVSWELAKWTTGELRLCINPTDGKDLFAIGHAYDPVKNIHVVRGYRTKNGGKSWKLVLEPMDAVRPGRNNSTAQGDPECAYATDGALLALFMADFGAIKTDDSVGMTVKGRAVVYRVAPGSTEWTKTTFPFHDRPYMSTDNSGGENHGTIYVADNTVGLRSPGMWKSTDGGKSWTGPAQPNTEDDTTLKRGEEFYQIANPGQHAVLLDGSIAIPRMVVRPDMVAMTMIPKIRTDVIIATNGGTSFLQPSVVEVRESRLCYITASSLAQDQSNGPFRGRIYITWAGVRVRHCEVLLSHSDDNGKTWSEPVIVTQEFFRTDARPGGDHELPYVAVNNRGILGITWYDTRDNPDPSVAKYRLRFAASADGGETFTKSVPVGAQLEPSLSEVGLRYSANVYQLGDTTAPAMISLLHGANNRDTNGLVTDPNGAFHAVWVDSRTGKTQIWSSTISVDGKALKNGATRLANMDDITNRVELVMSNIKMDPKARQLTADFALHNATGKALSGPLYLRIVSIKPGMIGTPSFVGTDNHESGTGAIMDFSSLLSSSLPDGATSGTKKFAMQLSPEQWVRIPHTRTELIRWADAPLLAPQLYIRVFGRVDKGTN